MEERSRDLLARALRAAILDARVYRELGDDPQEMINALLVVLIAAAAFGLGIRNLPIITFQESPPALVVMLAVSTRLTGWLLWAAIAYVVGTRLLRGTAGFRQLLKSLGIASGPGILALFFEVPTAGPIIFSISIFWTFATGLVAVHETQGYDWIRTFFSSALGWWLAFLVLPGIMIPIAGPELSPA